MADFPAQELVTASLVSSPGGTAQPSTASERTINRESATAQPAPATERLLIVPQDTVLPVISGLTPPPASSIPRTQIISFSVTDDSGLFSIIVVEAVYDTGRVETVHDGLGIFAPFSGSRTSIPNGFHYSFARTGAGWPTAGLTIRIRAFDSNANEATPQNYTYTVTNPQDPMEVVRHFKMRARDSVCAVQPAYVYWMVTGTPDLTGAECPPASLPCGTTPTVDLIDFAVALEWKDS